MKGVFMDNESIITALKNGNVPPSGVRSICLGRDKEIEEIEYLLDKVDEGKSFTRFLNGEYGAGKSFFLKVVEEIAYDEGFVVAWVTLSNDVPFNKIDVVYRNIAKNLRCKTGTSLEHIIDRWVIKLRMFASNESQDLQDYNKFVNENIANDLKETREHSNSFALAIENYCKFRNEGNDELANYAISWLRGDANIPFTQKRKFGVKGDIDKENAIDFLEALSIFVKSIGYSGLVVLIDEAEFIMNLHTSKIRDVAYNYIRDIYDDCNKGNFQNSLFIFAGTPQFFDDPKKGIPSYQALDDRITDMLDTDLKDMRKPIIKLEGFTNEELVDVAYTLIDMHGEIYGWDANEKISPILDQIVKSHEEKALLTGGKVTPRTFVRSLISLLDTVQQNQSQINDSSDILKIFNENETELEDDFDDDDW